MTIFVQQHWFEFPQMQAFDRYLQAAQVAPNHRNTLCQRANRCAEIAGGFDALAACNPRDFGDLHFPGERAKTRFHVAAIRWFQRFMRGELAGSAVRISCWAGELLMVRFHQYLLDSAGYSRGYAGDLCSQMYRLAYPQFPRVQDLPLGDIRRQVWAVHAFNRFARFEAGIPVPVKIIETKATQAPYWMDNPILLRFTRYLISMGYARRSCGNYRQSVHSLARFRLSGEEIPAGYNLEQIVTARMAGRSENSHRRTVNAFQAFEKFLCADVGIPWLVKPAKPKAKRAKPVKVPRPPSFEKAVLVPFEGYLLSTETSPQYAVGICRALHTIYREGGRCEVLAVCDPVAFVAERYPRGDWAQTRSRVATIRRFQAFWQVQQSEGALA